MAIYMKIDGIDGDVTAKGHMRSGLSLVLLRGGPAMAHVKAQQSQAMHQMRGTTKPNIKKTITVAKELGPDSPNIIKHTLA